MVTFLESTQDFRGTQKAARPVSATRFRKMGVPAYSLRILPVHREDHPSARFSFDILCRIADYAVRHEIGSWRTTLQPLALVCKSWSHVLEHFFGTFVGYEGNKASAFSIARSLEWKPERCKLIDKFSPLYFKGHEDLDCETYRTSSEAILRILELATSIKTVYLDAFHPPLVQGLIKRLRQLQQVRQVEICGVEIVASPQTTCCMDMDNILDLIADWPSLRQLDISAWKEDIECV